MVEKPSREASPSNPPRSPALGFDLKRAQQSIVGLRSSIPADAFTATVLGAERAGSGVVIRDSGLVATMGYLITEAETIWLAGADGRVTPGHALAVDQETGFGLVQALEPLNLPALEFGSAAEAKVGDPVVLAGGVPKQSVRATITGKHEFAGYWEYLLDEAIFTAPAHPFWGGAGLIAQDGKLLGIGSLHVQQMTEQGGRQDINMIVPIDLLSPILDDLLAYGRVNKPPRPWLGIFAADRDGKIIVASLSENGPAAAAGMRPGDIISAVGDSSVDDLADFYRRVWSCGPAGVEIPIEVVRDGLSVWLRLRSADRASFLKKPRLH
jgi:S1-C subfamily serine protease